jgi:formylglycine-generating enzyme required for sulfatase activity
MRQLFLILLSIVPKFIFAQDNNPLAHYVQEINNGAISITMKALPAGSFAVGKPGQQVNIQMPAFWMAATEITHDQFMAFRFEEKDLKPLPDAISRPSAQYIDLTWGMGKEGGYPANSMQPYTALTYCKWLYKKTGVFYRLPTELEWEYAAREGKNTPPPSTNPSLLKNYAWYAANSKNAYQKVASKKPNAWGLYDILGNVAEWCLDMYVPNYQEQLKASPKADFFIPRTDRLAYHTARGGSFYSKTAELKPNLRTAQTEDWNRRDPQMPRSKWWLTDGDFVGFRIVRPAIQPNATEVVQFFKDMLEKE